ncbi:hypothetical protein [Paenibacillus lignilyticus]|uniref:ATP-binding protein n=1 Tax=Paenibacillus lignilyticus TaxID=1172615 RepID=A0ABS5CK54_9BACL|nr:hypothetical protein [Paenibacillus lignilyticus]MBP3966255.1 hypothetical protein [Paenibacillus lignilyticus]
MRIEVAQHARMSERGSSLLRLIQNNDMPLLDLLIRESVQNSLDAATSMGSEPVDISFQIRDFNSSELNQVLEGIQENLNQKFPDNKYQLLEIKDSNTTGLTGPLHYNDVIDNQFGNLLKLIYEISMPQQKEGAGGSWGLGKTVYFRMGIGLVFYYSRIIDEYGGYSSRLAACLVEDERKEDALINFNDGKPKRGIAWWGQEADETSTMPLTNEQEIAEILRIFNAEPYRDNETGTTIIIPYINEESLLEGILPSGGITEKDETVPKPWWTKSVHHYLQVALQRWYGPRLANEKFQYGKWLRAIVGKQEIKKENMLPLFKAAQALYNRTPLTRKVQEGNDFLQDADVSVEKVGLRNIFNGDTGAGYISFVKLSREQLLMGYPDNHLSPFIQANKFDVEMEYNPPIVMYVRKPGMIVGYEASGAWTEGVPKTAKDEFILGLFVANSTNTLKDLPETMTVEEYIRKSEKADHTSWTDWNIGPFNPLIVSKVQRQVRKYISAKYSVKESENQSKRNIGLGKALAQILLPPENFGSKATGNKNTAVGGAGGKQKGHGQLSLEQPKFENGLIKVDFELNCGNKNDVFEIQLQVLSELGGIEAVNWESEEVIGGQFPMIMERISINRIQIGRKTQSTQPEEFYIDEQKDNDLCQNIQLTTLKTARFGTPFGARIKVRDKSGIKMNGSAIFSGKDDKIQAGIILVQGEGEME